MKVYLIERYRDNDEGYPEDFWSATTIDKVFRNESDAIEYLKNMSVSDILCDDVKDFHISEATGLEKAKDGCMYRSFHAEHNSSIYDRYNYTFSILEMEVE
jgi:hypothetical protein